MSKAIKKTSQGKYWYTFKCRKYGIYKEGWKCVSIFGEILNYFCKDECFQLKFLELVENKTHGTPT